MRFILNLVLIVVVAASLQAQDPANAFSFSCAQTSTITACDSPCANFSVQIPDLRSSTASYVVNKISAFPGCFRPYISPAQLSGAVSLTNLMDDSYSPAIILPFSFPFYNRTHYSLVVSTNGYISFDSLKASQFSHYGILEDNGILTTVNGTPQNLPSPLYDRELIMATYHDINSEYSTSPNQLTKFEVTGNAPHRKWILSYYKMPLYFNDCNLKIENISQLVLYESTGIVEVFVYSRENCSGWNEGRAMIGMQDYDRANAIMAPGRAASDTWGGIDLNEAWRFTPAAGNSLLKKVELYTLDSQLVATGNTAGLGNGNLKVNFNNVCVDSSTTFIVKSTYEKFDDPLVEIYGADTLHVIKLPSIPGEANWVGSVSNEWENPLNWSCNRLPDSTSNVSISQGSIVINSNITINSLHVQPGANVTVNPGYTLTVLSDAH